MCALPIFNLDLRDDGELSPHIEVLRAVLAHMGSRPVLVAAGRGSWIATRALGLDGAHLAAGLVLVDMPVDEDAIESGVAARLALPTLVVRGGFSPAQDSAARDRKSTRLNSSH